MRVDEVKRVGSFVVTVFASLSETGYFFGATLFPEEFVFSVEKLSVFFEFSCFGIENGIEGKERIDGRVVGAFDFIVDELL